MIARHRVVHRFPKSFDAIDARMIGRLEQEFDLRMPGQPGIDRETLVYAIVVEDENQALRLRVGLNQGLK